LYYIINHQKVLIYSSGIKITAKVSGYFACSGPGTMLEPFLVECISSHYINIDILG